MKKLLGTLAATIMAATTFAQISISGKVTNKQNKPLDGATVILRLNERKERTAVTGKSGDFEFTNVQLNATCKLSVTYVSMQTREESFTATESRSFNFVLNDLEFLLEPLEVKAIRASDKAPFTKTNISKKEIEKLNNNHLLRK